MTTHVLKGYCSIVKYIVVDHPAVILLNSHLSSTGISDAGTQTLACLHNRRCCLVWGEHTVELHRSVFAVCDLCQTCASSNINILYANNKVLIQIGCTVGRELCVLVVFKMS